MTARIEPSPRTVEIVLDKRQAVPFVVIDQCPSCGCEMTVDLAAGADYLSYPQVGVAEPVPFYCDACAREWQVMVRIGITLDLAPPATAAG